jgi:hypothetical protein
MVRAIVVAVLVCCLAGVALAQPGGMREPTRDPGHGNVSVDERQGSALPRYAGGNERFAPVQRIILGMLVALVLVTLIFGAYTIVHSLRQPPPPPPRRT